MDEALEPARTSAGQADDSAVSAPPEESAAESPGPGDGPAEVAGGGGDSAGRPFDEEAASVAAAIAAEQDAGAALPPAAPLALDELTPARGGQARAFDPQSIDLLADVNLNVKIELGRTRMMVEDILRLNDGSVVELDKLAGDPVDVFVNDRLVARGEVLVLNDNFCVRINEILAPLTDRVAV